jgi:hypothetical protein
MAMSGDEVLVLVAAVGVAASCWGVWLVAAIESVRFGRGAWRIAVLALILAASLVPVFVALVTGADPQVRGGGEYIALFLLIAAASVAGVSVAGSVLGLSALDGVVRRRIGATLWAVAGLWLGTGLINAGANVGRGATIYTTVGPLALALATFLVLVAVVSAFTRGFHAVRLDRDGPSGLRLAGLFVAWGLILGRAVAGDYESVGRTVEDFVAYDWPAALLLAAAIPIEWRLRPTVESPVPGWAAGVYPAAAYLAASAASVVLR